MSHVVKGNRRRPHLVALVALVLVGGAAALWGKTRLFPEPTAEARSAYSRGEWARAALLALRRLKEAPDDPEAVRLAARAAARQDQDQKAITIYRTLAAERMDVEDFFLLGRSLTRLGPIESAYGAFESALKRDPNHPETLAGLSALYASNDRLYAAEEVAERLAGQPASEARAQVMLGRIRAELQDPAGARGPCGGLGDRSSRTELRAAAGRLGPEAPGRLVAPVRSTRGGAGRPGDHRASRPGPRSLMAAQSLVHPGEGLEAGRRHPASEPVLSRRAPHRARAGSLRGRGPLRRLPPRTIQCRARQPARHYLRPRPRAGEPPLAPGSPARPGRSANQPPVPSRGGFAGRRDAGRGPRVLGGARLRLRIPRSLHDVRRTRPSGPVVHAPDVVLPVPPRRGLGPHHRTAAPSGRSPRSYRQADGRARWRPSLRELPHHGRLLHPP